MQDISLHLLDLVQNSIAAGATRVEISIREFPEEECMWLRIQDNGKGMDEQQLNRASDPLYTTRTSRKATWAPIVSCLRRLMGLKQLHRNEGTTLLAKFHTNYTIVYHKTKNQWLH